MKIGLDKLMVHAAYFYIVFPFILFCLGWLRWYYGVSMAVILVISWFLSVRYTTIIPDIPVKKHLKKIIAALLIILVIIFFSGIGNFSYQVEDHSFRSAIFNDLVTHKWPLLLNERGNIPFLNSPKLFTYYIEYCFPPALLGKVFGLQAANIFLYLWTVLGITLTFYFLCRMFRRFSLKVLLIFLFFNSLYLLVSVFKYPLTSILTSDYQIWSGNMSLAGSCLDSVYWIYNQTVAPWLIMVLLLNNIPKQNIFFLYVLCYMHAPFVFIGFFPFMLVILAQQLFRNEELPKPFISRIMPYFSFQNVVAVPPILLITYLFFSASFAVQPLYFSHVSVLKYALYISVAFGVICLLIFSKYKKDPFFYVVVGMLMILPLIGMGDIQPFTFCARVSLAPMFVLLMLVAKYVMEEGNTTLKKLVFAYLILGGIEPFLEFGRSVVFTVGYYIDPLQMNTYLLSRTTTFNDRINMLPKSNDLRHENYLLLDHIKTVDTSTNLRLINYQKQTNNTPFNKYLLKVKLTD